MFTTIIEIGLYFLGLTIGILLGRLFFGAERSGAARRVRAAPNVRKHDLFYQAENGQQLPIGEAEDAPDADSSAVRLPVSDLDAVANHWRQKAEVAHGFALRWYRIGNRPERVAYWNGISEARCKCADELRETIAASAPQRSGGERRKPNTEVSNPDANNTKP
jgi:hypothetical protein